jgi:hypothetical protein
MDFILSLKAISHLVSKAKEIKVNRIFRNSPRIKHSSDIIISTELIEGASFYKYVDMSLMPIRLLSDAYFCNIIEVVDFRGDNFEVNLYYTHKALVERQK